MTIEQIDKRIEQLKEEKKLKLKQEKELAQRAEARRRAERRKLESRVKYILGGVLLHHDDLVVRMMKEVSRETDRQTLQKYFSEK